MHGRMRQMLDHVSRATARSTAFTETIHSISQQSTTPTMLTDIHVQTQLDALALRQESIDTTLINLITGLNTVFVLLSAYLVFFMQCGFAMLTAGSVRTKNTKNVLLKNVLDTCVAGISYYLLGYAFAYGESGNAFISHSNFALSNVSINEYYLFYMSTILAATAATIVSGSVAERTSFYAYLGYASFLTSFVYPVESHWVWDEKGWLSQHNPNAFSGGMIDFAGSCVIHTVGGFAGLMGATIVGPRTGRFDEDGHVVPMPGHSATLCTLGSFVLWFGWYGFNPGSALAVMTGPEDAGTIRTIQRAAVTSTLSAAAAGLTTLVIVKLKDHIFDLLATLNGLLGGLVAITAGCAVVTPYMAIVIGALAAGVYAFTAWYTLKLRIDDPLEAFPVHGGCGMLGTLVVGFAAQPQAVADAGFDPDHFGVLYGSDGKLLLAQFVGVICIVVWTVGLLGPFFWILRTLGILRIPLEDEVLGNDISKHGGTAYPDDVSERSLSVQNATNVSEENFGVDEAFRKFPTEAAAAETSAENGQV